MKSVKMGREPSFMGGIMGIVAALFGLFWTIFVISNGGGFFGLFGLLFVLIGVLNAVRNFRNAFSMNRRSEYDFVDETEEPDPWNVRFGNEGDETQEEFFRSGENSFCPYCGNTVQKDFEFCNNCGRKLPD